VTLPAEGVTPDTIISLGDGPAFVAGQLVGKIVRVIEVRDDQLVVELDVDDQLVDQIKDDRQPQSRGYAVATDVIAVFRRGKQYTTLQEALDDTPE
jgi:hypothetical protein